jgi:hypothetical protein
MASLNPKIKAAMVSFLRPSKAKNVGPFYHRTEANVKSAIAFEAMISYSWEISGAGLLLPFSEDKDIAAASPKCAIESHSCSK